MPASPLYGFRHGASEYLLLLGMGLGTAFLKTGYSSVWVQACCFKVSGTLPYGVENGASEYHYSPVQVNARLM